MAVRWNVSISLQEVHVSCVKQSLAQQVALGKSARFCGQVPESCHAWLGRKGQETAVPGSVMLLTTFTKYLCWLGKENEVPFIILMGDPSKTNKHRETVLLYRTLWQIIRSRSGRSFSLKHQRMEHHLLCPVFSYIIQVLRMGKELDISYCSLI